MTAAPFTDLLPDVLPHLGGDPSDPVTIAALRAAADEFCAKSTIWREALDPITVRARAAEYELEFPAGAAPVRLISVTLAGAPLDPKERAELDGVLPGWRTLTGAPRFYLQATPDLLALAPAPEAQARNALEVLVALKPTRAAPHLPAWLIEQYGADIADGAMARLMAMTNRPWSDPQGAVWRRDRFEAAIATAHARATAGLTGAALRTRTQH